LPYGFHKSSETEWKRLIGQGLEIEELSCDHAAIMKGPYVARIAQKIRAAMDAAIDRDRRGGAERSRELSGCDRSAQIESTERPDGEDDRSGTNGC
jgi:hypothetical protein